MMQTDVLERLRLGEAVDDEGFDRLLPDWAKSPSRLHWTPVAVAVRAAGLLAGGGATRILDVGSGVGKFCLVGAVSTKGRFVGVEQRAHFVEAARQVVSEHKVDRCAFIHGNMAQVDWQQFDAYYLFNPFAEHRMQVGIDEAIDRSPRRYRRYVRWIEKKLTEARPRALLATYHGFGGSPPAGWKKLVNEPCGSGRLELWRKSPS